MGNNCEPLCGQSTDSKQLNEIIASDPNTGKLINLQSNQREHFIESLKNRKFEQGIPNEILVDLKDKNNGFIYFPKKYLYQGGIL